MPISFEHIEMSTPTVITPVQDGAVSAVARARAVRAIASAAENAGECALLLDMLGLTASDGRPGAPAPRTAR
jgi:hypothetical protein